MSAPQTTKTQLKILSDFTESTSASQVTSKSSVEKAISPTKPSFKVTTMNSLSTTSSAFKVTTKPIKIEESYGKSSQPTITSIATKNAPTSTTEDTATHKRRKHKHKKNKNKKFMISPAISTATVVTVLTVKAPTQSNNEDSTQRNITSDNKTAGKAENAADVQYTVIDTPVQEGNDKSRAANHVISHGTTLLQTMFMLCSLFVLYC